MVIDRASGPGRDGICLIVASDNNRAVRLYNSVGFQVQELGESEVDLRARIGPDNLVMTLRQWHPGA